MLAIIHTRRAISPPKKRRDHVSPAYSLANWLPYLPVPLSATLCGLPAALSENFTAPVRTPVCVGVKLTLMMQVAPAANAVPLTQGVTVLVAFTVTSAKSPVAAMVVMFSVALPVLMTTTFFLPAAVVWIAILPHFSEAGVKLIPGFPPPPEPASALIRPGPFGLPQPVAKS